MKKRTSLPFELIYSIFVGGMEENKIAKLKMNYEATEMERVTMRMVCHVCIREMLFGKK